MLRIDLIYDSVLSSFIVEVIRPKSFEFVKKRDTVEGGLFNTSNMFLFDYPL